MNPVGVDRAAECSRSVKKARLLRAALTDAGSEFACDGFSMFRACVSRL
jgi:hypothetical protein